MAATVMSTAPPKEKSLGLPPEAFQQTEITTPSIGADLSADKPFKTLQAAFALRGHALTRSDARDGPVTYFSSRWGMSRELADLDAARAFLAQIGGAL